MTRQRKIPGYPRIPDKTRADIERLYAYAEALWVLMHEGEITEVEAWGRIAAKQEQLGVTDEFLNLKILAGKMPKEWAW
jgi:hypothetical protein